MGGKGGRHFLMRKTKRGIAAVHLLGGGMFLVAVLIFQRLVCDGD